MKLRVLLLALLLVVLPEVAFAQIPDLNSLLPPGNGSTSGRIIQLMALLTVLSVAPGLLIMVTSFTRFVVALSFLRAGLGLQTTPANLVLISLALFMTFYVMAPTFDRAWETGVQPLMKNEISEEEAYSEDQRSVPRIHAGACPRQGSADVRDRSPRKASAGSSTTSASTCASSSRRS